MKTRSLFRKNSKYRSRLRYKTFISICWGIVIFIFSWIYQNTPLTFLKEGYFFNEITYLKYKFLRLKPKKNKNTVFIDTGNDLSLIQNPEGYGQVAVTDRSKLLKLLQIINNAKSKPKFILLDLQFYYPFTNSSADSDIQKNASGNKTETKIDADIQAEISKIKNIAIGVSLNKDSKIRTPLYKTKLLGVVDYESNEENFDKFRLCYNSKDAYSYSLPALLNKEMDNVSYTGPNYFTFSNGHLAFNYIWPEYYYNEVEAAGESGYQIYPLGYLLSKVNSPADIENYLKCKIVFIGNFDGDMHSTPIGKLPGTIILFDIYLSLLNGHHLVSVWWCLFMVLSFSILSYKAIYKKWPMVDYILKTRLTHWVLAYYSKTTLFLKKIFHTRQLIIFFKKIPGISWLSSLIGRFFSTFKKEISYITHLMVISIISNLIFTINIGLTPAFILILIEYASATKEV